MKYPTTHFVNGCGFSAEDDSDAITKMMGTMARFNLKHTILYRLNGTRYPFLVCVVNCHLVPGTSDAYADNDTGKEVQFHEM